jgi:hypothetical protein
MKKISFVVIALPIVSLAPRVFGEDMPLGELIHDGPPTPEQILGPFHFCTTLSPD